MEFAKVSKSVSESDIMPGLGEGIDPSETSLKLSLSFNKETTLTGRAFPQLDINNPEHQKIYFETVLTQHVQNLALLINN